MAIIARPRPVVRIYREGDRSLWVWLIPLLVFVLVVGGGVYLFLRPMGGSAADGLDLKSELEALHQQIDVERGDKEALRRELATTKRTGLIDKAANKELQANLAQREKEVLELKEELTFYKNLVSDDGVAPGVNIRGLTISAADEEGGAYHFKLVLTQVGADKKVVKGVVELRVQGRQGEESKALDWKDIRGEAKSEPKFGFQYFQKLEGKFTLPERFEPENVLVKVVPGGKRAPVQQSYSWNSILKGDGGNAWKEKR